MKSNLSIVSLLISLLAPQLQAGDELRVTTSEQCSQARYSVVNGSLVLQFDDLQVESNEALPNRRDCHIQVDNIRVPAGKMFRPVQAFVDGEVFTSENGCGIVTMDYTWMGETIQGRADFDKGILSGENFLVETAYADWWSYTPCSHQDQYASMSGNIIIEVSQGWYDKYTSSLLLANSEVQSKAVWDWQWQDCPVPVNPWNAYKFRSRYTNREGRWVRGYTELDGESGRYDLDNGSYGVFREVTYSADYKTAQGLWTFQNGVEGWFEFRLGLEQDSFEGRWGYGSDVGESPQGLWKGYIESH